MCVCVSILNILKWIQLWDAWNGSILLQGRRRLYRDSLDGLRSSTSHSSSLVSSHVSVYASSALAILNFITFPWLHASLWDNFMSSWKFLLSLVCLLNFLSSRSGLHCLALSPVIVALILLYHSASTLCSWFAGLWPPAWCNYISFICISISSEYHRVNSKHSYWVLTVY